MKFGEQSSIKKGQKKASIFNRICHRLHYGMWSVLTLGILTVLLVDGHRLEGVGLIVLALIGFVVFKKLANTTEPEDDYDADENGNAKPNYR